MNTQLISFLIALTASVGLTGCLEHTFQIKLLEDGRIEADYTMVGGPQDFQDDRRLFPDSIRWRVTRVIENTEDETRERLEAHAAIGSSDSLEDYFDWRTLPADTLQLRRDLTINRNKHLLGQTWRFTAAFYSRRFKETYGDEEQFIPPECAAALENDSLADALSPDEISRLEEKYALGILQWNNERYLRRFDQVWEAARRANPVLMKVTDETYSIARSGWSDDLRRYMNQMDVPSDPELMNLEWWSDLKPLFLGHFADLVGAEQLPQVISQSEAFEREYQITKNMKNDTYNVKVNLPGIRLKAPHAKREGGWFVWKCEGKELMDDNRLFYAASYQPSYWRVGLTIAIVAGLIATLVNRLRKRRG